MALWCIHTALLPFAFFGAVFIGILFMSERRIQQACLLRGLDTYQQNSVLSKNFYNFETLLADYVGTTREQWAGLKECLLLLGSHIASSIDHLISGLRTPAIAESAIRSAGFALIAANEAKAKQSSQGVNAPYRKVILRYCLSKRVFLILSIV